MNTYNKNDIAQLALRTNFLRDNLEKVLRLVDVLQFLTNNPKLNNRLILKGGTAINLTVFNMPRLSVDIDLDFHSNCTVEEMLFNRSEINRELLSYMDSQGYHQSSDTKNPHSLDSWVFFYQNAAGNRDNIKIEINYSMRQHVFEPCLRQVTIDLFTKTDVKTLHPLELFGSKIKALIERHTCRDLYDIFNLLHSELIKDFNISLLRKIVVFYLTVGGLSTPRKKYDFEGIKNISFSQIRATLLPMLRKGDKFNYETAKIEVLQFLMELMMLTKSENAFIDAFMQKKYLPELLFNENDIIERIRNHPMALWKIRNRETGRTN